jgi:DNA-binding response OmpR family regulator
MPHNLTSNSLPLRGVRIFVVEDEMMVSMLLEELLGEQGCELVGPVARLGKAIDLASTEKIDVALLDCNIDGKQVYPVAEILADRGIPFAFVSGYGGDYLDGLYRDRPILQKPFHAADLEKVVANLLSSADAQKRNDAIS